MSHGQVTHHLDKDVNNRKEIIKTSETDFDEIPVAWCGN